MGESSDTGQDVAVIINQSGQAPATLTSYVRLIVSYLYGLELLSASRPMEVASLLMEHGEAVRAIFLVQDEPLTSRNTLTTVSRRGEIPVLILMPPSLVAQHQPLSNALPYVSVCDWTQAMGSGEASLQGAVDQAFAAMNIDRLPVHAEGIPHSQVQRRLERRLKHVTALPTVPEAVLHIMKLLRSPDTTAKDLEKVILTDPAMVHKLLQVVRSPAFTGDREGERWSLSEAIVRLGLREVGTIAQQVKLMTALVRPQHSHFDLRQFWEHSVGCAVVADTLVSEQLIQLPEPIPFDVYWITSLLHDVGKLVLGFFAWDYYSEVVARVHTNDNWFRQAEERLGHDVTHEYLGRLVLLNAGADREIVDAVGAHDLPPARPTPLTCLVHVATNLCKTLGLACPSDEKPAYRASALSALNLTERQVDGLAATLGDQVVARVRDLASRCLQT